MTGTSAVGGRVLWQDASEIIERGRVTGWELGCLSLPLLARAAGGARNAPSLVYWRGLGGGYAPASTWITVGSGSCQPFLHAWSCSVWAEPSPKTNQSKSLYLLSEAKLFLLAKAGITWVWEERHAGWCNKCSSPFYYPPTQEDLYFVKKKKKSSTLGWEQKDTHPWCY